MIRYQRITDWVKDCQSKLKNDWDAVMLFTGKEGTGKSTLMFQVLAAVDPTFDADRMCMTLEEFLSKAPTQPAGAAIGVDEALILNRTGMTKHQIAFIKYLTVCRGLNHAVGIAYPHEALADKAIKDYRVRWRWHVPRRGLAQLMEPRERRKRNGDPYTKWVVVGQWSFKENKGPRWNAYQYKKRKHMEGYNPLGVKTKEEALGINMEAFNEIAPVLLASAYYPKNQTPTSTPPPTPAQQTQ